MKKVLVLGGYGNVGGVASIDLAKSGFDVTLGGRSEEKMKKFCEKNKEYNFKSLVLDFSDSKNLEKYFKNYDLIVNCLDFSLNAIVLKACLESGTNYIDLGDSYEGIISSHKLAKDFDAKKILACLGAGSSPGLINILLKYVSKNKKSVKEVKMSFADINHKPAEKMILPFNFRTVTDEVLSDALIFEDGKEKFVPGASEEFEIDFGRYLKQKLFSTAHDENYSIPRFLKSKGLKSFRYMMAHEPRLMNFVKDLNDFGFLEQKKQKIGDSNISPFDFTNSLMQKFMPQEFDSDDQEILWLEVDGEVFSIENFSQFGLPAGVVNTGIGMSLIAQYILNFCEKDFGMKYPEDIVQDEEWIFDQLKKRGFLINPKL